MKPIYKTPQTAVNTRQINAICSVKIECGEVREIPKSVIVTDASRANVQAELFCIGCELEGSFCEGRRCEWQSETFFERDYTRAEWKYIFYKNIGDRYYNLSLRNKIKLLK